MTENVPLSERATIRIIITRRKNVPRDAVKAPHWRIVVVVHFFAYFSFVMTLAIVQFYILTSF
jgi:hypothetical protein